MLSPRVSGLAGALIVLVCLITASLQAHPLHRSAADAATSELPLVATVGTITLFTTASTGIWRTRR
jgi:hypothetical protein